MRKMRFNTAACTGIAMGRYSMGVPERDFEKLRNKKSILGSCATED